MVRGGRLTEHAHAGKLYTLQWNFVLLSSCVLTYSYHTPEVKATAWSPITTACWPAAAALLIGENMENLYTLTLIGAFLAAKAAQ